MPPAPIRLRPLSFAERIRSLPAHTAEIQLQYASWWMFLVLYLLARIWIAVYMTCFGFTASRGIPITLPPAALTSDAVVSFASGAPIEDEHGAVVLDPQRDCLHVLDLLQDGTLLFNGKTIAPSDLPDRLSLLHLSGSTANEYIVLRADPNAAYQQYVVVLDSVARHNRRAPSLTFGVLPLSPE
jgi:biopolymer transport protein ExbD